MSDPKHPAEVLADYVAEHGSGNTADVSAMLRTIPALEAERDAFKAQVYEELDANHALRDLGGALPDEDMGTFLRRVISERDKYKSHIEAQTAELDKLIPMAESLEAERDALMSSLEFRQERQAQREQRLWQWAHAELSEELKTRYFNIVANGTADVMEQPTYAQQFNMMRHRAKAAEAERDKLREQLTVRHERQHEAEALAGEYLIQRDEARQERDKLMDKHNALHINAAALRAEVEALRQLNAELLGDIPEGCTPADARVLREANHALAAEVEALRVDAARWRWFIEGLGNMGQKMVDSTDAAIAEDAAIDAARGAA